MQVYDAPYVMDMLRDHVEQTGVPSCVVEFLAVLACSKHVPRRSVIIADRRILAMVEFASNANDIRSTAGSTKLQALYAASGAPHRLRNHLLRNHLAGKSYIPAAAPPAPSCFQNIIGSVDVNVLHPIVPLVRAVVVSVSKAASRLEQIEAGFLRRTDAESGGS